MTTLDYTGALCGVGESVEEDTVEDGPVAVGLDVLQQLVWQVEQKHELKFK